MTTGLTILQTQTVADSALGWSVPLPFNQFDPSLGTLTDVGIGIVGDVTGIAAIENLGATAASVAIALPSTIDVAAPNGTVLATVSPDANTAVNLGAYDGTTNFGGTSGTVLAGFSNVASVVSTLLPGTSDVVPFVGTGTIDLTASSQASSNVSGYGNLLSLTEGEVGASVSVKYDYETGSGLGGGDSFSGSATTILTNPGIIQPTGEQTTAVQTLRIADTATGWNTVVAANQFDPTLGTLESVKLTLIGDINAGLAVENLGTTSGSISLAENAIVSLNLGGTLALVDNTLSIGVSRELAAFDGTIDFGGTSGSNLTGLTNTQITTDQLYNNLSAFIGTGAVALGVGASSPSTLTGPADLAAELLTDAGATIEISYVYLPASTVTVPNDGVAPIITGMQANQAVTDQTTVAPFANVQITDPTGAQTETVTVTLSDAANGILTNLDGGTYDPTAGVYTVTGSVTAVTAALDGLVFTPTAVAPGQTVTTDFTITDADSGGASTTNTVTSVITTAGIFIDTAAAAAAITAEVQSVACFAAGTRIATTRGPIPVEHLHAGDTVLTLSGQEQAIEWIGRRTLDCRRHPAPERVQPVRIAAHAFGENLPVRPLLLSPDHAIFVNDVLIPVKYLINDTTITQLDTNIITYYHLELPQHDVVLAEGLPTESYLETGGRSAFANGGGATQLHPDFSTLMWDGQGCASLVVTGAPLESARAHLAAIAGGGKPKTRKTRARKG